MVEQRTIQVTMSFHKWSRLLIILEWVMTFKFFRTMNLEMDEVKDLYKDVYYQVYGVNVIFDKRT